MVISTRSGPTPLDTRRHHIAVESPTRAHPNLDLGHLVGGCREQRDQPGVGEVAQRPVALEAAQCRIDLLEVDRTLRQRDRVLPAGDELRRHAEAVVVVGLDQRARQVDERGVDLPRPDRVGGRDIIGHDANRLGRADRLVEEALLAGAIDHGPPQIPRRGEIAQLLTGAASTRRSPMRSRAGRSRAPRCRSSVNSICAMRHVGPLEVDPPRCRRTARR